MGEQLVFLTDITISILSSLSTGLNCFDFWKSFSRAVKTFKIVNTSLVYHQSPQNAQQWYRCLLVVAWSLQAVRIFVDQDCDSEVRIYVDQDCDSEVLMNSSGARCLKRAFEIESRDYLTKNMSQTSRLQFWRSNSQVSRFFGNSQNEFFRSQNRPFELNNQSWQR